MIPDANTDPNPVTLRIPEGELYVTVRTAVEDAILSAIGTLLLVGVALVLVWFGATITISVSSGSPLLVVPGLFVVIVGLYLAASSLGLVRPITDWQ